MTPAKRDVTVAVQTVLHDKVVAVRVEHRNLLVHRRADGSEYIYRNGVRCELIRGLVVVTASTAMIGTPMHHDACPRRVHPADTPDLWSTTYWDNTRETAPVWPEGFDTPRVCSYCGGAHPDDVIALLAKGWRVGETGKSHKRVIHPPELSKDNDVLPEPFPQVKVYVHHFTEAQREEFNYHARNQS